MNCATCKVNKIGPKTAPFGGYLCGNEHLQCGECNTRTDGQCGICEDHTSFVQMNFNQRDSDTSPVRRIYHTDALIMPSGEPSVITTDAALESQSSYVFPKAFYADIETQSSISQEQLSMHESHESLSCGERTGRASKSLHTKSIDNETLPQPRSQTLPMANSESQQTSTQTQTLTGVLLPKTTPTPTTATAPMSMSMAVPMQMNQYIPGSAKERIQMETIFFGSNQQPQSASNFTFQFRTENGFMRLLQQPKLDSSAPTLAQADESKSRQGDTDRSQIGALSFDGGNDEQSKYGNSNIIEDAEEVIHTSEIRFMESTESMKNYFSGGTMHPVLKAVKHDAAPPAASATSQTQNHSCGNNQNQNQNQNQNPNQSHGPHYNHIRSHSQGHGHCHNRSHSQSNNQQHVHSHNQQESLSMKMLHDFECHNTANPSELVENYLRSYGPIALCQFPAYSFSHSCHDGSCEAAVAVCARRQAQTAAHLMQAHAQAQAAAHTRSVSVSTESEPSLASTRKSEMPAKYLPTDYFVLHATGVAAPAPGTLPLSDKIARTSIDMRMQKVLETFQEDPRPPKGVEKPLLEQSKNFIKLKTAAEPLPASPPPVAPTEHADEPQMELFNACDIPCEEKPSVDIMAQLSNAHRAFYNPPSLPLSNEEHAYPHSQQSPSYQCSEPAPQYQLITCSTMMAPELLQSKGRFINMKPMAACHLNIPRAPIKCPESSCQRMIFVSDFNKHLIVDHSMLPMERIAPRQCKNFFLDAKLAHRGISKCHLLYLVRNKVTNLGSSKFKDFLPLLVMSTRIHLSDLCGIDPREQLKFVTSESNVEFLVIWLTGIVPEEFPVAVSLTVWPRSGPVPACHVVHSGEMYSVRRSQDVADVCRSGQVLLLSATEVELLTNSGKEMLELQIVVH